MSIIKAHNSIRWRLTLWYTGVLALVLVAFASASYLFIAQTLSARADAVLAETADIYAAHFAHEITEHPEQTRQWAAESASTLFGERYRDASAVIYDPREQRIMAKVSRPAASTKATLVVGDAMGDLTIEHSLMQSLVERATHATVRIGEKSARVFSDTFPVAGLDYVIVVAYPLSMQDALLRNTRLAFLVATPLALLLTGIGGYFLARKSLAPVVLMSHTAQRISAANLSQKRLPVANEGDELGHLARTFNALLARLDLSMEQQRRFMADASHELRTPIAIIRCESDVTLAKEFRSSEEYRQSMGLVGDESRRMSRIVEELLLLARADAGQYPLRPTGLYLDETLMDSLRAVRPLAAARDVKVYCARYLEMPFRGDEDLLKRVFINLLDNAVKHTPSSGEVSIGLLHDRDQRRYKLIFADTGVGIPPEDQPHIFERFYRASKARPATAADGGLGETVTSGAGLGLAIARWICELHNGRLELINSDSQGTIFLVTLPAPLETEKAWESESDEQCDQLRCAGINQKHQLRPTAIEIDRLHPLK